MLKSLPYYLDAPECFIIDQCLLCGANKPKSKVICDSCNSLGYIREGLKLRKLLEKEIQSHE